MGIEIERKFLVVADEWEKTEKPAGSSYRQGYMCKEPSKTVRVRLTDRVAYITIKGKSQGATRAEYEYPIPQNDAEELLQDFCEEIITKIRYTIDYAGKTWEVDVFSGDNEGLIIAEIELNDEAETFETPHWVGEEVTHDKRYFNSNLSVRPYTKW